MIRLTVLYNLPPDQDEEEFLKWRLGEHQSANMSIEGVVASEFHKVLSDAAGATRPPLLDHARLARPGELREGILRAAGAGRTGGEPAEDLRSFVHRVRMPG